MVHLNSVKNLQLSKIVKNEIQLFKKKKFDEKCKELSKLKSSESSFWKTLKKYEGSISQNTKKIPYLIRNNQKIFNDQEKSELFASNLAKIFTPYNDDIFDKEFEKKVNDFANSNDIFNYDDSNSEYNNEINIVELNEAIKELKLQAAHGPDKFKNQILKNLRHLGKNYILALLNRSFLQNDIPLDWKIAEITMIPKKANDAHNPQNYRPISLTNSLVKLLERILKNRLIRYLEENNLLCYNQSGFRKNRRTVDNIFYFKQKCLEAFHEEKKICGILFDIEKAFDKVWHNGLFMKLHEKKVPSKIANWIKNFLTDRKFYVNVNSKKSNPYNIITGVPQGSVLAPILFLIFIDDIPKSVNTKGESLLFADDLFSFYGDKNLKRVNRIMQKYLNLLEDWLKKWRLKAAANKCSYNIYQTKGKSKTDLNLFLFGEKIKKENNAKYLGIHIDSNVNFSHHINMVKSKASKKMNFLKVINFKKNKINLKTKVDIYQSMIRSNIDYAAPLLTKINISSAKTLESIQYHSMRIILNERLGSSNKRMRDKLGLETIKTRILNLKASYLSSAIQNNNKLIIKLQNEFEEFKKNHKINSNDGFIL